MEWEAQLMSLSGLSLDTLRMALTFVAQMLVGQGMRFCSTPSGARCAPVLCSRRLLTLVLCAGTVRHWYSIVTGILLLSYVFGSEMLIGVPTLVLTYLCMLLAPRRCGVAAWVINFPYLVYW